MLRNTNFHLYHIILTPTLQERDFIRRMRFCTWVENKIIQDSLFIQYVFSTFNNQGDVNRRNYHFYLDVNLHWQRSLESQRNNH